MINITTYDPNIDGLNRLRKDIVDTIGDYIFSPTYPVLCFHILKSIEYPDNHNLVIEEASIMEGCEKVKHIFLYHFTSWEDSHPSTANPSIFQLLIFNLLDLVKLPGIELKNLEEKVKEDLAKRDNAIKKYTKEKYIQNFKNEAAQPKNQEERTLHAFYVRNLDEQQIIIDYLLNGVKEKALEKSSSYYKNLSWLSFFDDRNYITAAAFSEKYFDHEQIDLVSHRLLTVGIQEGRKLKELYYLDKVQFYKELFIITPPVQVISDTNYYLQMLDPLTDKRKALFKEMFELYLAGNYYGFYALALGQVEGLFAEMLGKINPLANKSSLPEKVKALRSYQQKHLSNFDYYEFFIPLQRNKFMHAGIDDEIEIKAHDLLFDLMNVLSIYVSLDTPIVELTQMLKRRSGDSFIDEEGFVRFFDLMDLSAKHKDFNSLKSQIGDFEQNFLVRELVNNDIVGEIQSYIPQTLSHLKETVRLFTTYNNAAPVNLDLWTLHFINTKKDKLIEELKGVFQAHFDIFSKLDNYHRFISKVLKYMPSISPEIKDKIEDLKRVHGDDLNRIASIRQILEGATKLSE